MDFGRGGGGGGGGQAIDPAVIMEQARLGGCSRAAVSLAAALTRRAVRRR
jgi:hypothetical protein